MPSFFDCGYRRLHVKKTRNHARAKHIRDCAQRLRGV